MKGFLSGIAIFFFIAPAKLSAQYLVRYESGHLLGDTTRPADPFVFFLATNGDTVSYEFPAMPGKDSLPRLPLGKQFTMHSTYTNYASGLQLYVAAPRDLGKLRIADTVKKRNWQLLEEQITIAGYACRKAVYTDSAETIEAWYAAALPAGMGIMGITGLPGTVLQVYRPASTYLTVATSVLTKLLPIIMPQKGKWVTMEQYKAMRRGH